MRASLAAHLRIAILLTIFAGSAETLFNYTEDVAALADVPIVGDNSEIRRTIEALLTTAWMVCGFSIIFIAITSTNRSHRELQRRIQEAILSGAFQQTDGNVPPEYVDMVEEYYRTLSEDIE